MRLEKWFISNLDDSQRKIIIQSIDNDIIVQGAAGSGKTNLAIHRALQAKNKGSYAIVIFTVALKRMIAYGMQALGLDKERIAYEWAWTHRGFDLTGDVYWEKGNRNTLYWVNDLNIRKFERTEKNSTTYGIDFADWVDYKFYSAFGRRVSWFKEIPYTSGFSVTNTDRFELIPSGTMYKQSEERIDYLIIDEAQDFNVSDYQSRMIAHRGKSLSLFGDSVQQMNFKGSSIDEIANVLGYKRFSLDYNYRLPKTIAKVAQQIQNVKVDLLTNNMKDGGNSDYPNYPKPIITKYPSKEKELEGILNRIRMEDLDDVAILVPEESDVREVNEFLTQRGINTQVHYRTGSVVPFRTINTLDFSNNDLPCILTYYAAKGSEFDNVFVPFANEANTCKRNAFYVACTRSSRNLYISYTGKRTLFLKDVSKEYVVEIENMFYYISTSSWNLLESFVSESISPFSFYQERGYGNNLSRYLDGANERANYLILSTKEIDGDYVIKVNEDILDRSNLSPVKKSKALFTYSKTIYYKKGAVAFQFSSRELLESLIAESQILFEVECL